MDGKEKPCAYVNLLNDYQIDQTKPHRDQDALLAEKMIDKYSPKLHEYLYENPSSNAPGAVNRDNLFRLLTATFPHGEIPEDLRFPVQNPGMAPLLRDHVFRYDEFSQKRPEGKRSVYQLLSMLGVSVCPYCNRQYITTVAHGGKGVRPQIDHFHSKKHYPYLALSINNLIPSCGVCNLQKSDKKTEILYPYDEEMGDRIVFRARCIHQQADAPKASGEDFVSRLQNAGADVKRFDLSPGKREENRDGAYIITSLLQGATDAPGTFRIALEESGETLDDDFVKRANHTVSVLSLEQLYQSHKDYVANLFFQRYVFTEDYFASIQVQFPKLFKTADDVKHILRLMNYAPESWGSRPLAKLTHDITEQIDRLYMEK